MDDHPKQEVENLVYQCAAHYLEVTITPELERSMTEIAPPEAFASTMYFPEISLRVTRLWAVAMGEHTCLVIQRIQDGQVVYLARG